MLLTETVVLKWNSKIKKHYVEKGYSFTKMGDEFNVSVKDLTSGSGADVNIKCDYCGKEYTKKWNRYLSENVGSTIHKDCCINCRKYKTAESVTEQYGVRNVFMIKEVKDRISSTNVSKYGTENPFASEIIKERIVETNLKKYGAKSGMQNEEVKEKARNTCLQRYGVTSYVKLLNYSGEKSPVWKGGVARQRSERFTAEYKQWREDVYKRDSYTCQCCGKRGSAKLNAHHIYNWKDYPELHFDVDNGMTMCEECHMQFHSLYGKRSNTPEQLDEFIYVYGKKVC